MVATQGRSCSWVIPVILLLVALEGATLWMDRYGGANKELLCGEDVDKISVVQGAYIHHSDARPSSNKQKASALRKANATKIPFSWIESNIEPLPTVFEGVHARPFSYDNRNQSLPCFPPEENWRSPLVQNTPTDTGFIFVKPYKTGSSTSSGINLRVARNVAQRLGHDDYEICHSRFDHAVASEKYARRRAACSFMWTVIRSPQQRIISQFFHFQVSRKKIEPTDENFINYIKAGRYDVWDYYLYTLSTQPYKRGESDTVAAANGILQDYDFIGITERMDESVVVLSMLLDLSLADVLYLKAKGKGGYDDAGGRGAKVCTYIWPSFVSQGMQAFFETKEWKDIIHWDSVVYQAANRSLDLTIDKLGRAEFEKKLAKYEHAKEVTQERCLPRTVWPCSPGGTYSEQTDCLWNDSGCSNECMDEVATELDLW